MSTMAGLFFVVVDQIFQQTKKYSKGKQSLFLKYSGIIFGFLLLKKNLKLQTRNQKPNHEKCIVY